MPVNTRSWHHRGQDAAQPLLAVPPITRTAAPHVPAEPPRHLPSYSFAVEFLLGINDVIRRPSLYLDSLSPRIADAR